MDNPTKGFIPRAVRRVRAIWASLNPVYQLTLAGSVLVLLGMGVLGLWVSTKIETSMKLEVGVREALYMDNYIAPLLQELASQQHLSPESIDAIDRLLAKDAQSMGIVNVKVWARDGTILYGTRKEIIGQKFPVTGELFRAWNGRMELEFNGEVHLDHGDPIATDDSTGAAGTNSLFEIYVPIRQLATKRTIAVAEFYQDATILKNELMTAKLKTWAAIAIFTFAIIAGLYGVLLRESKTIDSQQSNLVNRVTLLSRLLKQNEGLRRRSAEDAEFNLRRLGSELHDGPGQFVALALLKLNQLSSGAKEGARELESVRGTLNDAMTEIRNISAGMILPEIEDLQLVEALKLMVYRHERHTSTSVACTFSNEPIKVSHAIKLCLCRFVQEALSNAVRHAGGIGQAVKATWTDQTVVIEVSDQGPGFEPVEAKRKRQPLGLIGLKNRLENLGGHLTVHSKAGEGTTLVASLPINSNGPSDRLP